MARISLAQARRIALAAQGFTDARPTGSPTARQFRRVMGRMTVLQLDSVNALCRSHYLPVLARIGPYDTAKLDRYLYRSGEHYEYLAHEASLTSQELHPHLRHRTRSPRWGGAERKLEAEVPGYIQAVLDEVVERGPLSIKDLTDPGERTGPWWGMSKGKMALEWLYVSGRLAIRERTPMFVTVYDLPGNVIRPDVLALPESDERGAKKRLVELGARSHGIGTDKDLADYFRLKVTDIRPLLAELVAEGRLEKVEVDGWNDPAFLHAEARRPRSVSTRALLSPFDPVVWFRPRAERLFGFEYRIEIYVPEAKRIYGYYVLPFLLDDELVARVDLKTDRKRGVLRVRGSYLEPGITDPVLVDQVATELAASLAEMAQWLAMDSVAVESRGDLAPALRARVS
jgi:uncharacterized protein YcaQ